MRWLRSQSGFTLVEIVIVFAITGLMIAGIIIGRGQLTQDTAFTTAIEGAKNSLRLVQNEAYHNLSNNPQASPGGSSQAVFGTLVQFAKDSSIVKTWTLVANSKDGAPAALSACNELDTSMKDGVTYDPDTAGGDPDRKSIIFSRQDHKTYIAPDASSGASFMDPATGEPNSINWSTSANPVCGSSNPALPPPPVDSPLVTGVVSPCVAPDVYTRPPGEATGHCTNTAPPAPDLVVTASDGETSSPGNPTIHTATGQLTLQLTSDSSGATFRLYVDGVNKPLTGCSPETLISGRYSTSCPYTMAAYGSNTFDITQKVGASPDSPASTPTVTVIYAAPPNCTGSSGYSCGLKGQYFLGTKFDDGGNRNPATVSIDTQVGASLGNGESSDSNFLPTLRKRTGAPIAQYVSVKWSGEIYVDAGKEVCVDSTDATLQIGAATASPVSGGISCLTLGNTSGAWYPITIKFTNNDSYSEGQPYAKLAFRTGDEVVPCNAACQQGGGSSSIKPILDEVGGSLLRVLNPVHQYGPPPSPQGLYGYYFSGQGYGNFRSASLDHVIGTGYSGLDDNWAATLRARTGDYWEQSVAWYGYLYIPHSGFYYLCTRADDGSIIYLDDDGFGNRPGYILADFPGGHGPLVRCSGGGSTPIALSAGLHGITMGMNNQGSFSSFQAYYEEVPGPGWPHHNYALTEIPNNWWSYSNYLLDAPPANGVGGGGDPNPDTTTMKFDTKSVLARLSQGAANVRLQDHIAARPILNWRKWVNLALALFRLDVAYAAADPGPCNNYILDPRNYSETCDNYTRKNGANYDDVSVRVKVYADGSHPGNIVFNHGSNTITWNSN